MTKPIAKITPSEEATGNVKVTRDDWLNAAMDLLVRDGVSEVKILTLGNRLGVSRSSFYWYFQSRKDLLNQLLQKWERKNTDVVVQSTTQPAHSINHAVCNFFRCMIDPHGFDHRLDFAVREWARRDAHVRQIIDRSDTARHTALSRMYERFGFAPAEADIRARVLYYQQIGYYALDLGETLETRMSRIEGYLTAFTGDRPTHQDMIDLIDFTKTLETS